MAIPKIFIKEGVQATKAAKEALAKLEKSVQKEVITTDKLVRTPASDLFEKKGYMEAEAFWNEPQNFANYARGQYLTEGGKAFQETNLCGQKIIGTADNIERSFTRRQGNLLAKEEIAYEEKNLLTGEIRSTVLYNGHPRETILPNSSTRIYHNGRTGVPVYERSYTDRCDRVYKVFAEDGKTVKSEITEIVGEGIKVKDIAPDGSYTVKSFKNAKQGRIGHVEGDLESISRYDANGNLTKDIIFHEGTKTPKRIDYYNETGRYDWQHFDKEGNLI